jgi:hypothetical protein
MTCHRSEFGVTIPFVEQLGIRLVELSRERAIVSLKNNGQS